MTSYEIVFKRKCYIATISAIETDVDAVTKIDTKISTKLDMKNDTKINTKIINTKIDINTQSDQQSFFTLTSTPSLAVSSKYKRNTQKRCACARARTSTMIAAATAITQNVRKNIKNQANLIKARHAKNKKIV